MSGGDLTFEVGCHVRWDQAHDGMAFEGRCANGIVQFVATAEALARLLDPERSHIDALTCAEVFAMREQEVHTIAQRVWRSRATEEPILIRREDLG